MTEIATRRLRAQRLLGDPFPSPVDAVRWLGAVQSQDYGGAKWALAQRTAGATDAALDRLIDEGAILRTHLMRPTWHFVLPEDIRWLLELTSTRLLGGLAGRYRQLEVIVSGPRRGKQFTYALLDERAPAAGRLERDEALAELTRRYFRSHGPAQIRDLGWWSGLTAADIKRGLAAVGTDLEHQAIDGKDYWFDPRCAAGRKPPLTAHLLPNFDEFTVAYRDRDAVIHPDLRFDPSFFAYYREAAPQGGILSNVVTIGGLVRGSWRRRLASKVVEVEVRLLARLDAPEMAGVERAAQRLGRFLERPADLRLV